MNKADAKTRKAFAYLRVSGLGQVERDGFPRQRQSVAVYAKSHRITIVDEFREEAVKGETDWDARDGLKALLDHLDANGVQLVLVERADRIARDLMVSEVLLQQFRERGVTVIEAEGGTDLTVADGEPTRVLIRQVLAAVAQFDKSCLVRKLRAARDRRRKETGRCEGPKPFGQLPGEATAVERIKTLHRRLSLQKIADQLNKDNVPTRTGAAWSKTMVKVVLDRIKKSGRQRRE